MKNKQTTWAVVFDSTICRIFLYNKDQIKQIKEMAHPENRLKDFEITSDKPGRYMGTGQARGAYTQETDPKEIKIENFSKEIAKILEHDNSLHAYEKLILVAAPHMHGLLLKHLNKQVKNLIVNNIEKDLVHFSEIELLNHVKDAMKKH